MMATSTATQPQLPHKKHQRLNPARRKAAKAKAAGQSIQPGSSAVKVRAGCSPVQEPETKSKAGKSQSSAAIPSQRSIPKSSPCKAQLQPQRITSGQSKSDHADEHSETHLLPLRTPASVLGGLAGCAAGAGVLLAAGIWSQVAGVESAILTARTSKMVVNNLLEEVIVSLKTGTYNAPEAFDILRRTTLVYAGAIPGGIPFVERLFREVDIVRRQRGGEVNKTLAEASRELANARKRGASASEMHMIVLRQLVKLSAFTSNATQDIMARNPGLNWYLSAAGKRKVPTSKINMTFRQNNVATTTA